MSREGRAVLAVGRPVPTFRVTYVPCPGVRLLIEDIVADAITETPLHQC